LRQKQLLVAQNLASAISYRKCTLVSLYHVIV
jgi:hypothetical protein